jgi:hypothetical protein
MLHAADQEVESLAQAPEALRPVAGEAAFVICAGRDWDWPAGGAGSAAYAIGEARKWPVGLARQPLHGKGYATITRRSSRVADSPAQQKVDEPAGKLLLPEGESTDVLREQLAAANLISAIV